MTPLQPDYRTIPLTQGQVTIVDAADYKWLNQWKWRVCKTRLTEDVYMKSQQKVKEMCPDAELYGFAHGKVRVESPTMGVLSNMYYTGTRELRRRSAWADAWRRIQAQRKEGE